MRFGSKRSQEIRSTWHSHVGVLVNRNARKFATAKETGQAGFSKQSKQEHLSASASKTTGLVAVPTSQPVAPSVYVAWEARPVPLSPLSTPLRPNPKLTLLCDPARSKCLSSKFILCVLQRLFFMFSMYCYLFNSCSFKLFHSVSPKGKPSEDNGHV